MKSFLRKREKFYTIYQIYNTFEYLFGVKLFKNWLKYPQILLSSLLYVNLFADLFEIAYGAFRRDQAFSFRLSAFAAIFSVFFIFCLQLSFVVNRAGYRSCLSWCERALVGINGIQPEVLLGLRRKCTDVSVKVFLVIAVGTVSSGPSTFWFHGAYNIVIGDLQLMFPFYWPGFPPVNRFWFLVYVMQQSFVNLVYVCSIVAACGPTVVTIIHLLMSLDALGHLIRNFVENPFKVVTRQMILSQFVTLHTDVMDRVKVLNRTFSVFAFTLELVCYGCVMLGWVTSFYSESSVIFVLYTVIIALQYFWICYANEKLMNAFDSLVTTIYNTKWYELEPRNRRVVVLVLCLAQRPHALSAGPFHKATFGEYWTMIRRCYSFLLFINNAVEAQIN